MIYIITILISLLNKYKNFNTYKNNNKLSLFFKTNFILEYVS